MKKSLRLVLVVSGLALSLLRCDCTGGGKADASVADAGAVDGAQADAAGADASGQDAGDNDGGGAGPDGGAGQDAGDVDAGGGVDAGGTGTEACTGAPTTSVEPGQCEVIEGTSGSTLYVGTVLTPGQVYESGAVLVDSAGTITCVGCGCFDQALGATQVICRQAVISPGLINAHDHIGWMGDHPRANQPTPDIRYEHRHDWRKGDSADGEGKISTSGGSSNDDKAWGELRFVLTGGTSINGSGTAPGLLRNLDKSSGLEGLSEQAVMYSTFPLGDGGGTILSSGCNYPGRDTPSNVAGVAAYTPHVSEGINAGARNEFLCLNSTANGGQDVLGSNAAIIHGVGLTASDIDAMAGEGMKLIWSPRSNVTLYGDTASAPLFKRLGVPIALGTDWIPSGSMNMLRELACADFLNTTYYNRVFSYQDLWRMVTYDAARALGVDGSLGLLAAGKVADIAIFFDHAADPYQSVVQAEVDDMMLVVRGGKVLAGRSATVLGLENGCDEIDVCGTLQRVCLQREVGKSYSQLQSAGGGDYPAFFCDTPSDEPSCVPYRGAGESKNGSSVYPDGPVSGDQDGDGVADGEDNCPSMFNPIRPLDQGVQADADNDNIGDMCDVCPLDPDTDQCSVYDPDDRDRDGVSDLQDNCPGLYNPAPQADADNDGKGDLCDLCPNASNPDAQGCPSTIFAIQDTSDSDHPEVGSRLRVSCAVTAIASSGFWCQDRLGGPYSGVYVYTSGAPEINSTALNIGDDLAVDATYVEYYDLSELSQVTLTLVGSGAPLAPELVTATDVATGGAQAEAYEGVLIRVEAVTVTDENADAPSDYDEFVITGGLRVDDLAYEALDNTYAVGSNFDAIVGVLHYSYGNFKLLPRGAADLFSGPARLLGFDAEFSYLRQGAAATATLGHSLHLQMTRAVDSDTLVDLSTDPAGIVEAPAQVTFATGESQVEILLRGLLASSTPVHLSASGTGVHVDTVVRVLAEDAEANVVAIDPVSVIMPTGASQRFVVHLNIPAPASGSTVDLAVLADDVLDLGTLPASVVVPYNALQGSFTFASASSPTTGHIEASVGAASPVTAHVEVVDPSSLSVDLSDYVVKQTSSSKTWTLASGTTVPLGGYVIIARNADQAAFELHWGVTLGANVVYVNAGDAFPSINGNETYSLADVSAQTVDGPSVAMTTGNCLQRSVPVLAASLTEAWSKVADSEGTPGAGQSPSPTASGVYISEMCDASGDGNFKYEFIEIYVDGAP